MFERSPYGVQNRALFLRVKYVIYTEGEQSADPSQSVDRAFWTRILKLFRPDLAFTILVKGGKGEVIKFADYVIANNVNGTAVALDRDYDDLCGTMIADKRIVYTYGYSWENDIVSRKVCTGLIKHILFASAPRRTTKTMATHDEIVRKFLWLSIADQIGLRNDHGIISRKGYRKHVTQHAGGHFQCISDHKQPIAELRMKAAGPLKKAQVDTNIHRRLFGKLYLYVLLAVLRRDIVPTKRKFTDDEFLSSLFNVFGQVSTRDISRPARDHYRQALAGL